MRGFLAAAFACALAACASNSGVELDSALDANAACTVEAAHAWAPRGHRPMTITAVAIGPTCPQAFATLTIRSAENNILWTQSYPTAQVMVLADSHHTSPGLRDALLRWIDPATIGMNTTADLPRWAEGAEAPAAGEFPFYPEEGMTRDLYEQLRAEVAPMFCYVQGMESIACVALRRGRIDMIGVQSFPG